VTHASSTNYDFVVAAGRALASKDRPRVLDFGCGLGQVVERGVAAGLDMVGVDTFEGQLSNWRDEIPPHIADRIHCIAGPLPFPDASFDVVITNQVFEHIADPRTVLPEIRRVLKTGGAFLALFPVRETWYEGHVGLYFAHHLRARPRLLRTYLRLAYLCGFGLQREGASAGQWARQQADFLRVHCHYHRRREVERWLRDTFGERPRSMAADYVAFRLQGARLARWIPRSVRKVVYGWIADVRAGVVLSVVMPVARRQS
jgi:SAM-dependent methyltransferase